MKSGGFSLVEMIVVLGIVSLSAAVAVPAFREWAREDDLTIATRRVEALFRVARDSAIRGGMPVTVVIDSVTSLVWVDTAKVGIELPSTVRLELSAARARFTFAPGGAAFADSLVLRTPLARRLVTLDPWTSDVVVR
jgi:prepilin-type N-terminal cleavage/methylation domain-containing protein